MSYPSIRIEGAILSPDILELYGLVIKGFLAHRANEALLQAVRDGQWDAIDQLVTRRGRVLCVQRTGWGKGMVYFVAAKLMREQGINLMQLFHFHTGAYSGERERSFW